MLYSKKLLDESYYKNRIIVDEINCMISNRYDIKDIRYAYILLDDIENYKGDATFIIYENGEKNEKRIEIKQRQNYDIKELYNGQKKYDTIMIQKNAVDYYESDIYIQYDKSFKYILIFDGKDIDKSYYTTKTIKIDGRKYKINYYNVDIEKCKIVKL